MEKGISIKQAIYEAFSIEEKDIRTYSPLTLAYIGDGVFEMIVRTMVVGEGNVAPNELHGHSSHIVKAASQAAIYKVIEPCLTEEEADIYRRGRNAKSKTAAKNASISDYRSATGFEALMGYLYLTDQLERALELSRKGILESGVLPDHSSLGKSGI